MSRAAARGAIALAALALCACAGSPRRSPAGSDGPPDGPQALQLASFERAWTRIGETYPHADMRGLDWSAVREELLPAAAKARTPAQLRPIIARMIARLGESHYAVLPADPTAPPRTTGPAPVVPGQETDVEPPAPVGRGDLGMDIRLIGKQFIVTRVDEDGPADRAGIRSGWVLQGVNGIETRDVLGRHGLDARPPAARRDLVLARAGAYLDMAGALRGEPGSTARMDLLHGDGGRATLDLARRATPGTTSRLGHLPELHVEFDKRWLEGNVGYIRFNIFLIPVAAPFQDAVQEFIDAGARGVILDLRGNPGGVGGLTMAMAGRFFSTPGVSLGTMTMRGGELKFVAIPRGEGQVHDGPVAVLVDDLSMSTSELLAAGLQQNGRARVFGTQSAGMALPSVIEELPNGDRLQFAIADLTGPGGMRLEGDGVMPDDIIELTQSAYLDGDPVIAAALDWIETQPQPDLPVTHPSSPALHGAGASSGMIP